MLIKQNIKNYQKQYVKLKMNKQTQETNLYKWHFKTKIAYTEKIKEILKNLSVIWVVGIGINFFVSPLLSHKFTISIYHCHFENE